MAYSACLVPPGSESMANDHEGSPGTWETLPSPSKCRPETRLTNSRWIHGPVSWAVGDERGTQRWYRQAKETKCGERDVRESQRLIVPSSRGDHPEGPRGGKEAPSHEPLEGNMIGTPRPATVFTKQQRIAELARNGPEMAFRCRATGEQAEPKPSLIRPWNVVSPSSSLRGRPAVRGAEGTAG